MSQPEFNPEKVIAGLKQRRAQERQNRALAFAGLTHTVCGREILPLTPAHRLQLQLVRNAFFTVGIEPTLQDVFVFLWVLSPDNAGRGIDSARQQYFLREDVKHFDLRTSFVEIARYLTDQLQDVAQGRGEGKDQSPWIHWAAMDSEFYITTHHMSLAEYMHTPFLVLQQLYRAYQVNHPEVEYTKDGKALVREPMFRNASDRLVSDFQKVNKERIKAWHLSQKGERRN